MLQDELEQCILHPSNDCFIYTGRSLTKIIKGAASWKQDWLVVFRKLLVRIKTGHGAQDGANNDGKVVTLPLDKDKCMMIFFTPENNSYSIYDFKIDKRK